MGKKKRVPSHHFEKRDGKEQLIFRKLIQSQKVTLMVRKMNLPYFFFFSELPPEQKKKKKDEIMLSTLHQVNRLE